MKSYIFLTASLMLVSCLALLIDIEYDADVLLRNVSSVHGVI
jgi:hypothetical protein